MVKNIPGAVYSTEEKSRAVWIRLSEGDIEKVKGLAEKDKLTVGQFVKKLLLEEIEKESYHEFKKTSSLVDLLGPKTVKKEEENVQP